MKKYLVISVIIFLIIGAAGFALFYKNKANNNEKTAGASSQNTDSGLILFYSTTCPHCLKVEQYIKDNNVSEKIKFDQKEVSGNKDNSDLLVKKAESCGIKYDQIGVPLLWDGSNCLSGDQEIINYFAEHMKTGSN